MLPVFIRQQLKFKIYIIEQHGDGTFNRAKLLNAGYRLAKEEEEKSEDARIKFDCFFFHDVDLILENDQNIYECSNSDPFLARHFLVAWSKYNYRLKYSKFFGGITGVTTEIMEAANGLSNEYWGWGGEDDDFYYRVTQNPKVTISRPSRYLGRYKMIPHQRDKGNEVSNDKNKLLKDMKKGTAHWREDGLKNLDFEVVERDLTLIYERIVVDIGAPNQ